MQFNTAFEEEQRVGSGVQTLTYAILFATGAIIYFTMAPTGDGAVAFVALAPVFVIVFVLFATLKMTTTVSGEGVRVQTLYFISRLVRFDEIERADATEYRPLLDYGGWGLRISPKGKAYNMRGNRGVQLHLKNGGRVLIGSQRAQELEAAIKAGLR